ncbi:MAG: GNAT family N-acetyltransferase [Marmoricola sp.]
MLSFIPASTDDPVAERLLDDYFHSRALSFTTHAGGYRIAHPDPGQFVPPAGIFLIVCDQDGRSVGCGGVRRIDGLDGLCTYEVKHVWIEEGSRGRGWSRLLMTELEQRAAALGAHVLVLDTNESLAAAQHLYRTSGYVETPPYNDNKNATHWFKKHL